MKFDNSLDGGVAAVDNSSDVFKGGVYYKNNITSTIQRYQPQYQDDTLTLKEISRSDTTEQCECTLSKLLDCITTQFQSDVKETHIYGGFCLTYLMISVNGIIIIKKLYVR